MTSHQREVFLYLNMSNTEEFLHPTVKHEQLQKWDPFLQNDPEIDVSSGMHSLHANESFTLESGVDSSDETALESARGELADIMSNDATVGQNETGFEVENSGIDSEAGGIESDGGNSAEGGEGEGGENE